MNRPRYKHIRMKGKDTTYLLNHIPNYRNELEKYCDKLEKRETPMKVNKKKVNVGTRTVYLFSCPKCKTYASPSYDKNYCSSCGQRLMYEDE